MRIPAPKRVVLFADMLGFASLTEQYSLDPEAFRDAITATPEELYDLIYSYGELNPLAHDFLKFHQIIEKCLADANRREHHESIVFSDSLFVASQFVFSIHELAIKLMRDLIDAHIPARMGIGYGEFLIVRVNADMSIAGGMHSAQFLGSAVVRAHAAEQCGVKGMRILLHPSVTPLFESDEYRPSMIGEFPANKPLLCAEHERATAKAGVTHELDFLGAENLDFTMWSDVIGMQRTAPENAQHQYEATLDAINAMRAARGRKSLDSRIFMQTRMPDERRFRAQFPDRTDEYDDNEVLN